MKLRHRREYMRKSWLTSGKAKLRFAWDGDEEAYVYCHNRTEVGYYVLNASDIIDVTGEHVNAVIDKYLRIKEMNKNYIGKYDMVVIASYELDSTIPDLDGKKYAFKCSLTDKLSPNDLVVVDDAKGLHIVRVIEVVTRSLDTQVIKQFNKAKAWVVCKIDTSDHELRIQATERKKFIVQQLKERKEQMEEVAIYKMLAQTDSEAAKLLEELEKLS